MLDVEGRLVKEGVLDVEGRLVGVLDEEGRLVRGGCVRCGS